MLYICSDCAKEMDYTSPKGHMPTMHEGECDVCGKQKTLSAETDWIKPNEKERMWD
jgi:DNA-directed RNA polymerase subunit RPC12/RpoP